MTDGSSAGRRAFADVMTFPAPDDSTPATASLLDFVFAEVWDRPGLSRRDRRFVTLPCVAAADAEGPLRDHVYAALNSGDVTITEMREMVLHFAVYSGWPKASRFNMIVDEQWERIHRERGRDRTAADPLLPLTTPSDPEERLAIGRAGVLDVNCVPYVPIRDNPYSGAGILNFVFGEMWLRPGLGMKERRLVTVACVAFQDAPIPDLEPRLRGTEEPRHLVRRNGRTRTCISRPTTDGPRRRTSTTRSPSRSNACSTNGRPKQARRDDATAMTPTEPVGLVVGGNGSPRPPVQP